MTRAIKTRFDNRQPQQTNYRELVTVVAISVSGLARGVHDRRGAIKRMDFDIRSIRF